MKNEFYHGFTPGFNAWYVLLPFFLVVVIVFALTCLKLNRRGNRILKRDEENFMLSVISIVFDIVLHVLFLIESGAGLIQLIINRLGPDSDASWVLFILPITLMYTAAMFYLLFFESGKIAKNLKNKYLMVKIERIRKIRHSRA